MRWRPALRGSVLMPALLLVGAAAAWADRPELARHRTSADGLQQLSEQRTATGTPLRHEARRQVGVERRRADRNAGKLEGYLTKLLKSGRDPSSDPEVKWALDGLTKEVDYARDARELLAKDSPAQRRALAGGIASLERDRPALSRAEPGASPAERKAALRGDIASLTAYVVKADAYGVDASKERAALEARRGELISMGALGAPRELAMETSAVPEDLRDGLAPAARMSPVGLPMSDFKPKPAFAEPGPIPEPRLPAVSAARPSALDTFQRDMSAPQKVGPGVMRWAGIVDKYARQYNVPPKLILAVIDAESEGKPNSTSPVGARGLMQVMPATGRGMGFSPSQLYDPDANIHAGVEFLSYLLKRYHGDTRLAVAAYNAGEGAVDRYGGVPPYQETRLYVSKVMSNFV